MSEKKTKKQELQELQQAQLRGQADTITANKNGDHEIAAAEKDRVHVRLSRKVNNPATQSYDEQSRVDAIDPLDFAQMEANNAFHTAGWDKVEILHDPRPENAPVEGKRLTEKQQLLADYARLSGEEADEKWTVAELKEKVSALEPAK